jgi:hypothetical protein
VLFNNIHEGVFPKRGAGLGKFRGFTDEKIEQKHFKGGRILQQGDGQYILFRIESVIHILRIVVNQIAQEQALSILG